tara:strand:- start:185 stop:469 length:285 start_codon:yes stop_codon:yes gene_type:complete
MTGKQWNNDSFHSSFSEADQVRQDLLKLWGDNPIYEGMQVKIRRLSERFVVKTRLHPDFEPVKVEKKKGKKRGKNSRRNREAAKTGKSDTPPAV